MGSVISFSYCARGPHPRALALGDFAPRAGRRRSARTKQTKNLVRPEAASDGQRHGLRVNIFPLALGPHPQRELTLMPSAWPQALMPPAPCRAVISYGPTRKPVCNVTVELARIIAVAYNKTASLGGQERRAHDLGRRSGFPSERASLADSVDPCYVSSMRNGWNRLREFRWTASWVFVAIAWWSATAWVGRQEQPWALALTNWAFALGLAWSYVAAWSLATPWSRQRHVVAFRAIAITSSIIVGLAVFEAPAVAGLIDYGRIRAAIEGSEGPAVGFVDDRELLYRRAPNMHWTGQPRTDMASYFNLPLRASRPITFSTDRNGFRNLTAADQADVALIGDSYIEATSVSDDETAAVRLHELTGLRVANLGVSGYGSLQELKMLQQYALPLQPRMVAWFFFEGNDLDDDQKFENGMIYQSRASNPAPVPREPVSLRWRGFVDRSFTRNAFLEVREMTDWLVPNGIDSFGWFQEAGGPVHRFYFYDFYATRTFGAYEQWRFERTRAAFRRGLEIAREHNIRLVVFYVPIKFRVYRDFCSFPAGSPCLEWLPWDLETRFAAFCREAGIEFVSLIDPLRRGASAGELIYAPGDSHWNADGQLFVAKQIKSVWASSQTSRPPAPEIPDARR